MRRPLMRSDATARLRPVDVGAHADFSAEDAQRIVDFLSASLAERPLRGAEILTVTPGEAPSRESLDAFIGWARANGLHAIARRASRLVIPRGSIGIAFLGDEAVRLRTFDVSDLAAAEEAPSCAALMPAPPGERDAFPLHRPGEPWRAGKWVAPMPRRSK